MASYKELRKRGFFGWVFLLLFYGVNIWFAWAVMMGLANVAPMVNNSSYSAAERTGANIGMVLGFGSLLAMWTFAAVITGLLALMTRGKRVLVEVGNPHVDERRRIEAQRETEKWRALSSEPLPKVVKPKRDLIGPIVIGCLAVIALVLSFAGISYVIGTEPPAVTQVDYTPQ